VAVAGLALRWLGVAFVFYGATDAANSLQERCSRSAPDQQRTPVLSRSVTGVPRFLEPMLRVFAI